MSHLAIMTLAAGACIGVLHAIGMLAPAGARAAVRAFPRHRPAGLALTAIDVLWVALLIQGTHLGFAERFKPLVLALAPVMLYLIGRHMGDLLAPRALGGVFLLAPGPLLHAARSHLWAGGAWPFVIPLLAYALVGAGTVLVLSPFRFRQYMAFWDRSEARFRAGGALGAILGAILVYLGITVY